VTREKLGLGLDIGVSSFPVQEVTLEGLLDRAESEMRAHTELSLVSPGHGYRKTKLHLWGVLPLARAQPVHTPGSASPKRSLIVPHRSPRMAGDRIRGPDFRELDRE
jgi:hypothetical protein